MKKLLLFSLLSIFTVQLFAQLNVTYRGNLTYDEILSDIWGYVAPDGTEYAIVGVRTGVSIVSLENPENPTQVAFLEGAASNWRDIKTWGEYAYVTNETGGGVAVIDLSDLPNSASQVNWAPNLPNLGTVGPCHNIFIDEFGFAYLSGCNVNDGGLLFVDVMTTPGSPIFVGAGPAIYSHDSYARANIVYTSDIEDGVFTIYDVTDKTNPIFIANHPTDADFTHNAWLSDDSTILFTTDEVANAPIGSYDISDPDNITELDLFRPYETLGDGVLPHNVHVWNDWLIISYYTDGCIIVDGSRPENLVEVGNFDTYIPASTGFEGAWGAYPYLPSGLILISDIGNGLYVLEPNYVRACWLEGNITDASNSNAISNATIQILDTNVDDRSTGDGSYATGYGVAGTYDVFVKKAGYAPQTISVELENGEITELDVALEPLPSFAFTGTVIDASSNAPVPQAKVNIYNEDFNFDLEADDNGVFNIPAMFADNYDIYAGKWGYKTSFTGALTINDAIGNLEIPIEKGLEDPFALDLGWTASGDAFNGQWERGEPFGVFVSQAGFLFTPDEDVQSDLGEACYVTGNGPDLFEDGIAGGDVILTSPVFDLTAYNEPWLSYASWFFTVNPQTISPGDDELRIILDNGLTTATLELITMDELDVPAWTPFEVNIAEVIEPTANMQLIVRTGNTNFDLTESALDDFRVWDAAPVNTTEVLSAVQLLAVPNPSTEQFQITFDLPQLDPNAHLVVYNALGELVHESALPTSNGQVFVGADWIAGVYIAQIQSGEAQTQPLRLVKQ